MKFILPILIVLCSCIRNTDSEASKGHFYNVEKKMTIDFAKGFEIEYNKGFSVLKINSLSDKYPFSDSLVKLNSELNFDAKKLPLELNRIACQSSTHLAFLKALSNLDLLVGMSDINYLPEMDFNSFFEDKNVSELNQNGAVNIEKLISTKTDLFLMYPFEWDAEKYHDIGVSTLLISEYLEETPLAKLEWIKVFGFILDKSEESQQFFNEKKEAYLKLKIEVDSNQSVFFNLPFKDEWHMPAQKSTTAALVKDAGLNYHIRSNSNDNMIYSKEFVWNYAMEAEYWVIVADRPADYCLNDLLNEESVYKEFKAVKNKNVLFCNTSMSSYFIEGVIEPEIMLKDILYLTGKIEDHQTKYFNRLR